MLAINCRGYRNCQYVSLRVKLTPGVHEGGKDEVEENRDRAAEPAHLGPVGHRQKIAQHHADRVQNAAGHQESATAGFRFGEISSAAPVVACDFDHHGQHNQLDAEKDRIGDQTGEPVLRGRQPLTRKKYHQSLAQDTKRKCQNRESGPCMPALIWNCRLHCARAFDHQLYFVQVFRCGAEKLRFELRVAAAALENYLGPALEPTNFHHAQNRRAEPPGFAFLRVFNIQFSQARVKFLQQLDQGFWAWHGSVQFDGENVQRLFRIGAGAEMLHRHVGGSLRPRHGVDHLVDVQLFAGDAGEVAAFANEFDERRLLVKSSDPNQVVNVVAVQSARCRKNNVIEISLLEL
jgi:hypothetical protein